MADKKISALNDGGLGLKNTDLAVIVQDAETKKTLVGDLKNFMLDEVNTKIQNIENVFKDTKEPSGFIRHNKLSMGVSELCDYQGNIHRIFNGVYSLITDGLFYDGSVANPLEYSLSPIKIADGGNDTYSIYISGSKYIFSQPQTIVLPDITELQFIYHDSNGHLQVDTTFMFEYFEDKPITSTLYLNKTQNQVVLFGDERHGITTDGGMHRYLHFTDGTRYVSGMNIKGVTRGGTTFSLIESGEAYDEDIDILPHAQSTIPHWEFLYDSELSANVWSLKPLTNELALIVDGKANINCDSNYAGFGVDYTPSGEYVNREVDFLDDKAVAIVFISLTNDVINPYISIVGQEVYVDKRAARANIGTAIDRLYLIGLPTPEFLPMYAILIKADGSVINNDDGSVLYDLRNIKTKGSSVLSTLPTNHQDLLGLDDIDIHPINSIIGLVDALASKADTSASTSSSSSITYVNVDADYLTSADEFLYVDTTANAITVTLPDTPLDNIIIGWLDNKGTFGINNLTINGNGKLINGDATFTVDVDNFNVELIYNGSEWRVK